MKYRFLVSETRVYQIAYEVEADSLEEAIEKAENGETEKETDLRLEGVSNRNILKEL
jgi:hypothetical protein